MIYKKGICVKSLAWAALAIFAVAARPARAAFDFSTAGPLNINATFDAAADQTPDAATDGLGTFIAVWNAGGFIYQSQSIIDGAEWSFPAKISNSFGDGLNPRIAADDSGNWVIVWSSLNTLSNTIGSDSDILFSRSTNSGESWSVPAALNSNAALDANIDLQPQISTDGAGNWICVWEKIDGETEESDLFYARSSDFGATWSAASVLNSNAADDAGDDFRARIANDGAGHWTVVWQSTDSLGGTIGFDSDILVARSGNNGATWSAPAALNANAATDAANADMNPDIATDGAGHWIAVWHGATAETGADWEISVARSGNNGLNWSAPAVLDRDGLLATARDQQANLETDGLGHWFCVWTSEDLVEGDQDILVARSTNNGATWTAQDTLNSNAGVDFGNDAEPNLLSDGASNWIALWSSNNDPESYGGEGEIFFAISGSASNTNFPPTNIGLGGSRSVNENSPSGTLVGVLNTIDPDPADSFFYTFIGPEFSANGRFKFSDNQLQVASGIFLNYENQHSHVIRVRSTDNGGLSTDKPFTIAVNDVNEAPASLSLSNATVDEGAANGTIVGNLSSTDPDAGATFTYSFAAPEGSAGSRFAVAGTQLVVGNGTLLDFEAASSHVVRIRTTDNGNLFFEKTFTIALHNINEAPTNIGLSGPRTVSENAANGALVGTLSTVDPDQGDAFQYAFIAPELNAGGRFQLVNAQLQAANGALLDYETRASHPVRVRSTDQGGLSTDKVFTIGLIDVNENPTDIFLSGASVNENAANGTTIGNLSTTDPDAGETFVYSFAGPQSNAGGRFAILDAQLKVGNGALLNFENASSHAIRIRSTDHGALTKDKVFTIIVNDVNETPTNINLSGARSIAENSPAGASVGDLSGLDPDQEETFTFSFTGPESNAGGRFQIVGNQLQAGAVGLDFESKKSWQVRVRATDHGGLFTDKVFTIAVTNVNEAPTSIALGGSHHISENAPNGTVVGDLSTVDPDAENTFTYAFAAPQAGASARFSIAEHQIRVAGSALLDYEAQTSHQVRVRSTDQGGLSIEKVFTIFLDDVPGVPSNIGLSGPRSVHENSPENTVVGTLSTVDVDGGKTYTYTFLNQVGSGNGRFKIVGDQLKVVGNLDYEQAHSYALQIVSTDANGLNTQKNFTINLIDVPGA